MDSANVDEFVAALSINTKAMKCHEKADAVAVVLAAKQVRTEADVFANLSTGGFTVTLDKRDGGLGMGISEKQLAHNRMVV